MTQENSNVVSTPTLSEALPTSLNDLFEKDPLDLTDKDIETIVVSLRAQRANFIKEDAAAKSEGRRVNTKKITKAEAGSIKLDELDLGL